ncbi:type II toxin-antitoxin system VapB family antitoxin [Streptomyces sp. NPDC094466]|uniref:type II toxin-antitoxin system VapB family antitoxin n=1 Tax=Streptomyces sp. NPDC094466 TaxID=3366065 RepID=UPI0037F9E1E1
MRFPVHDPCEGLPGTAVPRIHIDEEALERAMARPKARPEKKALDLAPRFHAEQQERAARIGHHFERARGWGAVEDAERRHRAEKDGR